MKTGLHQHTALRQDLRINPRLYQAMDLLYMPLLDLQQHLKQELLGNPFLELIEPEDETELPLTQDGVEEKKETENNDEPNWEDILLDDGSDQGTPPRDMSEAREYVEPVPVETKDLSDHLRDQMRLLDLTPRQQLLAEEFIGNIAEDGYLGATPEEIVRGPTSCSKSTPSSRSRTCSRSSSPSPKPRRCCGSSRNSIPPASAPATCGSVSCCSSKRATRRIRSRTASSKRRSRISRRTAGATSASGSASTPPRCSAWPTSWPSSTPSPGCSIRPPARRTSSPISWSRRSTASTTCS